MEDQIYQGLMSLGLGEKESRVYMASVKLRKSTIQKISRLSGVNRASTYVAMELLIPRGLINVVTEGRKKYFVVDSIEKLAKLFQSQKNLCNQKEVALKYLLPELMELFESTKGGLNSKVKFYNGEQGLQVFREELMKSKSKEAYGMYNYEEMNKYISNESSSKFSQRKVARKISTNLLVSAKDIEAFKKSKLNDDPNINIVDITKLDYKDPVDISQFGNKLFITSLEENLLTAVIQDKNIATSVKSLFHYIEKNLK